MVRKTSTIQDIARLTGVSTATVSRTLSHPERVAEATRIAVLEAVSKTGYRVNRTARNLRRQSSGQILALVPNMANPFFSEILSGLSSVLASSGHGLLIADTHTGPDPATRLTEYLTSGMADGAVIFDGRLPDLLPPDHRRLALILACEWGDHSLTSVRVDNDGGAEIAVRYLLEHGHRRIGHVAGPDGNVLTESRRAGLLRALKAAGLGLDPAHHFAGDFGLESGARAAQNWLALMDRPTAVFCASDQMACGFVGALQRAGVSVPGDVSVVGFDDIDVAAHLSPALTTIRQPRRQIGERAAQLILQRLQVGAGGTDAINEVLPVELVARSSVQPPRADA